MDGESIYMNFFDDERNIVENLQMIPKREVLFLKQSFATVSVFKKIYKLKKWESWTYNAGKSDPPPDFFSGKYNLMMEVMRVDDHAFVNEKGVVTNPVNIKESRLQKEFRQKIRETQPDTDLDTVKILINAVSDLPSKEDHNYGFYYDNFKRTVSKHIDKIPLYRKNHPDKKLIFLIFDESTGYVQVADKSLAERGPVAGEFFQCDLLWHFLDKRFVDVFKNADIDYLVWFTPYKMIHGSPVQPPKICVFDMKKYNFSKLKEYPEEYIVSSEE